MEYPILSHAETERDGDCAPLSDSLDALVNDRARTAAAEALALNYRTVPRCRQSRQISQLMRQVLVEVRDSRDVGGDGPGVVTGDGAGDGPGEVSEQWAAQLEQENRELRETVEAQAEELGPLRWQVAELVQQEPPPSGDDVVDGGQQGQPGDWRPPRRRPGKPDAGVVTLERLPDEAHAFGPAVPLVAEWRKLRTDGDQVGSRVDRAAVRVRRWELEVEMPRDWQLTLPPETDPLDESRRKDHVRWRGEALAEAGKELGRAERARLLERMDTLGLSRK